MKTRDFERLSQRRCKEALDLMEQHKGPEYQRGKDRLSNFKRAAAIQEIAPEQALIGMWVKHLVSLLDLVDDLAQGRKISLVQFREKLTDSINYHLLLEGLVVERLGTEGK